MRAFSIEISGNRVRGGELPQRQRDFAIALTETRVKTEEIAEDFL
jgi:hypothetical protein